jgi:transcriptional regulator HMO1
MSKPSLSSLFSLITAQQAQIAALTARLDAPAPAPAPAPKQKQKRAKKERDPNAPKKPLQGFFLFQKQERAKVAPEKIEPKVLSERWRALTDEERASFKPAAAAAAPAPAPAAKPTFQEVRDVAAKMSSTVAAKFVRFCVMNPTLDAKTAEARWKALSPEEKAKFNDAGDDTEEDDDSSDDDDEDDAE